MEGIIFLTFMQNPPVDDADPYGDVKKAWLHGPGDLVDEGQRGQLLHRVGIVPRGYKLFMKALLTYLHRILMFSLSDCLELFDVISR